MRQSEEGDGAALVGGVEGHPSEGLVPLELSGAMHKSGRGCPSKMGPQRLLVGVNDRITQHSAWPCPMLVNIIIIYCDQTELGEGSVPCAAASLTGGQLTFLLPCAISTSAAPRPHHTLDEEAETWSGPCFAQWLT